MTSTYVFIGCALTSKAYRFLDLDNNTVIESFNVDFF